MSLSNKQKKGLKNALSNDSLSKKLAEIIADAVSDITSAQADIIAAQADATTALGTANALSGQLVGSYRNIGAVDTYLTSLEENIDLQASALALDAALFITMNAHAADGAEHGSETLVAHSEAFIANGTAGGIVEVADSSAFIIGDEIEINDGAVVGPLGGAFIGNIVVINPGVQEFIYVVDGVGVAVDLSAYLVINTSVILITRRDAPDVVNFPLVEVSTDLASLIVAIDEKIAAYVAHDGDANLGIPILHNAQIAAPGANDLASILSPADWEECMARLNDIKAKLNLHDAEVLAHTVGSVHQEATADVAAGDAIFVPVSGVLATDLIQWSVIDGGAGPKVGAGAIAGVGGITFTFNANPAADTRISYSIFREIV